MFPTQAAWFIVTAALAFTDVTGRVRGVVVEPGTNQPVVGAAVTVSARPGAAGELPEGWKAGDYRRATSDENGGFAFAFEAPGDYLFTAVKAGYVAVDGTEVAEAVLTREKPEADIRLELARPGTITGRLVDEESGEAARDVRVRVLRVDDGMLRFFDAQIAPVNAAGEFRAAGLNPGKYAIEVAPPSDSGRRVRTTFTAEDADAVERGYAVAYWPGGAGPDAVLPVEVGAGETVTLGSVVARKADLYRVRVRLAGVDCAESPNLTARVAVANGDNVLLGQAACAPEWLVTGFSRGTYRLEVSSRAGALVASVPLTIVDKSVRVDAVLAPAISVEVEVTGTGYGQLPVVLRGTGSAGSGFAKEPADPNDKATFTVKDLLPIEHQLLVRGLGGRLYVKEVWYNGVAIEADRVPLDLPAAARRLQIAIGDDPGEISGTAKSKAIVYAQRSPRGLVRWTWAATDASGRFRLTGLAPGSYRVAAVIDRPGLRPEAIERAVAGGARVEVSPRGMVTVELDPVEPK